MLIMQLSIGQVQLKYRAGQSNLYLKKMKDHIFFISNNVYVRHFDLSLKMQRDNITLSVFFIYGTFIID